jgi:hypothetical protein
MQKAKQRKKEAKKQGAATVAVTGADSEATEDVDQKPPPKDRSNYKCWSCGKKGHLANSKQCPNFKRKIGNGGDGLVNGTWQNEDEEFNMFAKRADSDEREYTVNNAVNQAAKLRPTEILLDNQADISIVHPQLLTNIPQTERTIKVRGVGGLQLIVNCVGILESFSKYTLASIRRPTH